MLLLVAFVTLMLGAHSFRESGWELPIVHLVVLVVAVLAIRGIIQNANYRLDAIWEDAPIPRDRLRAMGQAVARDLDEVLPADWGRGGDMLDPSRVCGVIRPQGYNSIMLRYNPLTGELTSTHKILGYRPLTRGRLRAIQSQLNSVNAQASRHLRHSVGRLLGEEYDTSSP